MVALLGSVPKEVDPNIDRKLYNTYYVDPQKALLLGNLYLGDLRNRLGSDGLWNWIGIGFFKTLGFTTVGY